MRDLNDADTGYEVRWARFCVYRPRSPGQVSPKMGSERPAFDAAPYLLSRPVGMGPAPADCS